MRSSGLEQRLHSLVYVGQPIERERALREAWLVGDHEAQVAQAVQSGDERTGLPLQHHPIGRERAVDDPVGLVVDHLVERSVAIEEDCGARTSHRGEGNGTGAPFTAFREAPTACLGLSQR